MKMAISRDSDTVKKRELNYEYTIMRLMKLQE